ncbi:hypothetical protein CCH79_00008608, partial [Gambusia affinis]
MDTVDLMIETYHPNTREVTKKILKKIENNKDKVTPEVEEQITPSSTNEENELNMMLLDFVRKLIMRGTRSQNFTRGRGENITSLQMEPSLSRTDCGPVLVESLHLTQSQLETLLTNNRERERIIKRQKSIGIIHLFLQDKTRELYKMKTSHYNCNITPTPTILGWDGQERTDDLEFGAKLQEEKRKVTEKTRLTNVLSRTPSSASHAGFLPAWIGAQTDTGSRVVLRALVTLFCSLRAMHKCQLAMTKGFLVLISTIVLTMIKIWMGVQQMMKAATTTRTMR